MSVRMTSKIAKGLIKDRARSSFNDFAGAIEEVVNTWNADLIAVKWGGEVVEYEIKCSKADLAGEIKAIRAALDENTMETVPMFRMQGLEDLPETHNPKVKRVRADIKLSHTKIAKHRYYLVEQPQKDGWGRKRQQFRPHKFYFAVPSELIQAAKDLLRDIKFYGIYNIDTGEIVKNARKLHNEETPAHVMFAMFTRACTERNDMENAYRAETYYRDVYENGEKIVVWNSKTPGYHRRRLNKMGVS